MRDRRRRRSRRRLRAFVRIVLIALAIWLGGLVYFTTLIPDRVADGEATTDAIVVLTGGGDRVKAGLQLLVAGKAQRLLISGVHRGTSLADLLQAAGEPDGLTPELVQCCISMGYFAGNTAENARETAEWTAAAGFRSLRLVTADYHMPRSLLEFRHALPAVVVIPHPVFPAEVRRVQWWRLVVSEYHKYVATVARGWIDSIGQLAGLAA
jgi:uncharacterized SAM-binding protein YcdF (DUF218 family)